MVRLLLISLCLSALLRARLPSHPADFGVYLCVLAPRPPRLRHIGLVCVARLSAIQRRHKASKPTVSFARGEVAGQKRRAHRNRLIGLVFAISVDLLLTAKRASSQACGTTPPQRNRRQGALPRDQQVSVFDFSKHQRSAREQARACPYRRSTRNKRAPSTLTFTRPCSYASFLASD